jgi:hypothetical protein
MYQVRLTVGRESETQPLHVVMDPRSPATPEVLANQFETSKQIYREATTAYRTLLGLKSVQTQLASIQKRAEAQAADIKSRLTESKAMVDKILADKSNTLDHHGLEDAYHNLVSALRVVEGGDRPAPEQAFALYKESSKQIGERTGEWTAFKQTTLPALNERLRQANLPEIAANER